MLPSPVTGVYQVISSSLNWQEILIPFIASRHERLKAALCDHGRLQYSLFHILALSLALSLFIFFSLHTSPFFSEDTLHQLHIKYGVILHIVLIPLLIFPISVSSSGSKLQS